MLISTCSEIFSFKPAYGQENSKAINSTLLQGIMTQEMNTYMGEIYVQSFLSFVFYV